MSGPDDLYAAAVALLVDAANALATTDAGTPALAVVYPGPPAFDCCPMLSVHWTQITHTESPPGQATLDPYHRNIAWVNLVSFTITALRCDGRIPDGAGMPNPVDINSAAKAVADDAWALNHLITARGIGGTLFGTFPCMEFQFGQVQQLTGQGAAVGCELTLTVGIQGYA